MLLGNHAQLPDGLHEFLPDPLQVISRLNSKPKLSVNAQQFLKFKGHQGAKMPFAFQQLTKMPRLDAEARGKINFFNATGSQLHFDNFARVKGYVGMKLRSTLANNFEI